ncbi:mechanosensitive ion channel family protein [Nannocystis bainbridge]|uniref:Mechanosensitive ion channel family protein n=1 Tax=Nannocystis bainbridge TaxID=2995303 RepID=A0ABT5E403_9BACT|nr:mechanosensitive ion channel family protein [Nannocystis bainbridge]MDC0719461.1 mechanosensitive ion channel family protein [Nannocystis bainbridge]
MRDGEDGGEGQTLEVVGHVTDESWLGIPALHAGGGLMVVLAVALVVHALALRLALPLAHGMAQRSRTTWDDVLVKHKVLARLVPIAALVVIGRGVGLVVGLDDSLARFVERMALAAILVVAVRAFGALLTATNELYTRNPQALGRPIKGYLQGLKVLAYIGAAIVVIATLLDQSPWLLLSGLGAMTAVLLLIFRDTLLSFVAGIQLTTNDLIRVGDWLEMPQFDADGGVVDISLNVVKVQNWDATITVIPTHKFLEHSFKNWRAMFESGGRRIKRAVHIDMATVRFLDAAEIERLSQIVILREYLASKVREVAEYNEATVPDDAAAVPANGRHLTNLGTFRAYVEAYLRAHPKIHPGMMRIVRQLHPTPQGLPLEIYVFSKETAWVVYEGIQADIFDHVLAIAPEFGLRVFQAPSGNDLARLGGR